MKASYVSIIEYGSRKETKGIIDNRESLQLQEGLR